MNAELDIAGRRIGAGRPCFIIAELSANHLQDFDIAARTVRAAKEAGVDAIKLQTYTADTVTIDCDNEYFQIKQGTLWDGKTLHALYKEAYTPWEWQPKLFDLAAKEGLICFSSVNDATAVDFLEKLGAPAYKLPSFEITDVALVAKCASTGKPLILSSGVASLTELEDAVKACRAAGNEQLSILKCTSVYPAPAEDINLRTMRHLAQTFGVVPGFSDHTLGTAVSTAAVALGACVIEKHFILDRKLGGPDAPFSSEPAELKALVESIRQVEAALGRVTYEIGERTKRTRVFVRSLFVVKDIKAGETITSEHVRSIRPGYGLAPKHLGDVLGKKAARDAKRGTPLSWDLLSAP